MRKGEQTQLSILQQATEVFNTKGFSGTSMKDLMDVTGLSKGAIYAHFESKDDLALQAFDYAVGLTNERLRLALQNVPKHAIHRLLAVVHVFRDHIEDPIFMGGCPIMNTAIEADDTHPLLLKKAQEAMDAWSEFIIRNVNRGIQEGQLKADLDGETVAVLLISSLEGGIMMSKLYNNSAHINHVVDYLSRYVESLAA